MSGPAAPFSLGEGDDACLLLHGLTGAPAEVRPVGEALARAGFRAVGPLLPGHGTSPQDLETVTRSDMLDAAREALLSLHGARRVYLCGLSMGALLAVRLAAKGFVRQGVAPVSALALLAPAVDMAGLTWVFTQVLGRLPAFPGVIGKGARDIQPRAGARPHPARRARPDGFAARGAAPLALAVRGRPGAGLPAKRARAAAGRGRTGRVRCDRLLLPGGMRWRSTCSRSTRGPPAPPRWSSTSGSRSGASATSSSGRSSPGRAGWSTTWTTSGPRR